MGLTVTECQDTDNNTFFDVAIDLTHNDGLDMSLSGNPTVLKIKELQVFSLFRRRRLSTTEADGNPLIYAIKNLNQFRIDDKNSAIMWDTAEKVFSAWTCPWKPTGVMSIPSRHSVSNDLAANISKWMGIDHILGYMICKKTVEEVLVEAELLKKSGAVHEHDLKAFKKQLGHLSNAPSGKNFQMKEIKDVSIRHYFQPWKATGETGKATGDGLLLVDDLIGSGASLVTCAQFLTESGYPVVGGMSLFSPLDREMAQPATLPRRRQKR